MVTKIDPLKAFARIDVADLGTEEANKIFQMIAEDTEKDKIICLAAGFGGVISGFTYHPGYFLGAIGAFRLSWEYRTLANRVQRLADDQVLTYRLWGSPDRKTAFKNYLYEGLFAVRVLEGGHHERIIRELSSG